MVNIKTYFSTEMPAQASSSGWCTKCKLEIIIRNVRFSHAQLFFYRLKGYWVNIKVLGTRSIVYIECRWDFCRCNFPSKIYIQFLDQPVAKNVTLGPPAGIESEALQFRCSALVTKLYRVQLLSINHKFLYIYNDASVKYMGK